MAVRELRRILLVEDELDIQIVTRVALRDVEGFEVEICGSGHEALAKAPLFQPDLILLDVMMPELDGPGTLRALRRIPQLAATPVIFVTAKAQPDEVAEYRKMGALEVIVKPFNPMTLGQQVRRIWTEHSAG
ncbi:MAG: response regulator [bacterium]|nr:response regulator [bacterium]